MNTPCPSVLVVMGVSGSGKTTIATALAKRLGWETEDADGFHSPENVEKMRSGTPLTDEDRWPWLRAIAAWAERVHAAGRHATIGCSALKRAYRDVLVGRDRDAVRIVYLDGSRETIGERISRRKHHYMPASLLDSQFAALEVPSVDERPITVSIDAPADRVVDAIVAILERETGCALPQDG